MPRPGRRYIQATLDAADLNKDLPIEHALVGDAALTLEALNAELKERLAASRGAAPTGSRPRSQAVREPLARTQWMPKLTSNEHAALARTA